MSERRQQNNEPGPALSIPGQISEKERTRRKKAVDCGRNSVRLEGFVLAPEIDTLNQRYIDGELSSEELTAAIRRAVG